MGSSLQPKTPFVSSNTLTVTGPTNRLSNSRDTACAGRGCVGVRLQVLFGRRLPQVPLSTSAPSASRLSEPSYVTVMISGICEREGRRGQSIGGGGA
eukprot:7076438-Prymnesium_polylepis.1